MHEASKTEIRDLMIAWTDFWRAHDWHGLIEGREPQFTKGPIIYGLPNPLNRPNESFSIADMSGLRMDQVSAHYHTNGETEIHFVLEGSGLLVRGGQEIRLKKGDAVAISPETAHYTIPDVGGLVLGVVNTPPFAPRNNVSLSEHRESDPKLGFDYVQFTRLTAAV